MERLLKVREKAWERFKNLRFNILLKEVDGEIVETQFKDAIVKKTPVLNRIRYRLIMTEPLYNWLAKREAYIIVNK